ncbi:hypothetical protein L2E82_04417 [Cichorium intybus]|uniref:Uncharacterized protein n=1 Tax=Cichorium intybus TaxID=13427 RepID=A0ACB9H603_CICIN|nr:hypothetical protein L2E82_04417 [Cichorium intybus]
MPEATSTQSPTPSTVNTSTRTVEDPVEESDVTISTRADGCLPVTVINKMLMPADKCATIISDSFCERVDPEGYCWAAVSDNIKEFYWDEFKKNCFWEEQDNKKVRTAWKTKASVAYSQYVFNMRNPKRNKNKKKPTHVSENVWASWWLKWNSDDFKKISDQNKVNRRNGVPDAPARPTHTSGSASHLKIASKLKRSLGYEPAHSEFFLYTHTTNHDGENFINDKDREIHAAYLEKRKELQAIGDDVDDNAIFYDVVGGHDKKRRLYGFGSYGKVIPSNKGSNDTYYTPETNAMKELSEKNAELAQMKELAKAQKEQNEELKEILKTQAEQLKTQNEQSTSKIEDLEKKLQIFFDSLKDNSTK